MEQLLYNGKIYIERDHFETAIYIVDNRIQQIGSDQLLNEVGPNCQLMDLQGKTVVPGFHDSHMHLGMAAQMYSEIQLLGSKSIQEVQQRIVDYIKQVNPPKGAILHGVGWNQDYFVEKRMLTKQDLDQVASEYALILDRACTHIVVANQLALDLAGIDETIQANPGGSLDYETGLVSENALSQIKHIIKQRSQIDMVAILKNAMSIANEKGLTSIQTMDMHQNDWQSVYKFYEQVQQSNPTVRIVQQVNFQKPAGFEQFIEQGFYMGKGNAFHQIGPLKVFLDGSLGARTAWMRQPYSDDPSKIGVPTLPQADFDQLVQTAKRHGFGVIAHAIGDAAVQQAIDTYGSVIEQENTNRLGIVHCQITDEKQLEQIAKLDLVTYMQPIFLHYDLTIVDDRVGKALAQTSYALKSMADSHIHAAYGTDCPVEDMSVMDCLYCAVNRTNLEGQYTHSPNQRVDIQTAVDAYTIESAYACFKEKELGRLKPGYLADLVILDQDLFTIDSSQIREVGIVATMVDGRFVYQR